MTNIKHPVSSCLSKATTNLLLLVFLAILSCQKNEPSLIDAILGEYEKGIDSCPLRANLLDDCSIFTIKKSVNLTNTVEIYFKSTRGAIWFGQLKNDSLLFSKQVVVTTVPDYPSGANEIKGFGVIKENAIDFQIEEHYIFNGYRHTCTFSAVKK
jgi:hypothetical protein